MSDPKKFYGVTVHTKDKCFGTDVPELDDALEIASQSITKGVEKVSVGNEVVNRDEITHVTIDTEEYED
jgi:hypothetical protein